MMMSCNLSPTVEEAMAQRLKEALDQVEDQFSQV